MCFQELMTDDRFTVRCDEGYDLVGQTGSLVCFKDDVYSDNLPSCQKVDVNVTACTAPFVQSGNILGTPLTGYYITVRLLLLIYWFRVRETA